jgi:hypothetical protein
MSNEKYYAIVNEQYAVQDTVGFDPNCNGFVVKNAGTTLLSFDNEILQPQESKSIGGNYGEYYCGDRKKIYFIVQSPAPSSIKNLCIVTQKIYINKKF